jgi:hypothetical protein
VFAMRYVYVCMYAVHARTAGYAFTFKKMICMYTCTGIMHAGSESESESS